MLKLCLFKRKTSTLKKSFAQLANYQYFLVYLRAQIHHPAQVRPNRNRSHRLPLIRKAFPIRSYIKRALFANKGLEGGAPLEDGEGAFELNGEPDVAGIA